jgi:long-chain fatty acid transport protein
MRRTAVTVFCASLLLSSSALASGFGLRESSASSLGLSYAGVAANGSRASAITFNPGLLGDVDTFDMSDSAIGLLPTTDGTFTATTSAGTPVSGNTHPKDIVNTALVAGIGVRYRITDHIVAGLGFSSPWGMITDYGTDSVTRYYNEKSDVKTANVTPMLGIQFTPEFTLGAGVQIQYIKGTLSKAIDFGTLGLVAIPGHPIPGAIPGGRDGQVALKAQNWGYGWVIGAEWKPTPAISLGLSYRSAINHTLKGKEEFTLDAAAPPYPSIGATLKAAAGLFADAPATAPFTTPYIVTFGVKYAATDKLNLLLGVDYTGWHSFKSIIAHSANVHQPDDVTMMNWKNSLYGSVGVEYKVADQWTLRAGTAYDETPTVNGLRTPGIPDGSRYWISAGVGYQISDHMTVDASIAHLTAQKGAIALTPAQTGNSARGTLTGNVNLAVTLIGVELGYHL